MQDVKTGKDDRFDRDTVTDDLKATLGKPTKSINRGQEIVFGVQQWGTTTTNCLLLSCFVTNRVLL